MRRKNAISRFSTLLLATLACLLTAVLAPMLLSRRATDEPFSGYSVMASPTDMLVITVPVRLSDAPDLTLTRGTLYADGNAAAGTQISRFVLDGGVFQLNASGPAANASGLEGVSGAIAPLMVEQLIAMGFDALTVRRGTLHVTTIDGGSESIADIDAELTGWRKGQFSGRGNFTFRGQRLAFEATLQSAGEKRTPQRWPIRLTLKGDLLEASAEGHLSAAEDLRLTGQVDVATPSLRRTARWFGLPIGGADGLNTTVVKGHVNWSGRTLAVEDAKVVLDGNEATGALTVNFGGERPLIDATLAFGTLDIAPYIEAARSQTFLFDRHHASWSAFDLSFPIIKHVDADLRLSATKVAIKGSGLALGRGAATVAVRSGKLLADVAELELHAGKLTAQVTASANEIVPRYTLRGKVENFDAAAAGASLLGTSILTGRSTLAVDVQSAGQTPAELLRGLSGKATLILAESGRVALDMRAIAAAAKAKGPPGWGLLGKGQTNVEQLEARAVISNGVLVTEAVQARSGSSGIAASGRIDLAERTLDLQLFMKSNVPTDRPLKPADVVGADSVTVRGSWQEPFLRGEDGDALR